MAEIMTPASVKNKIKNFPLLLGHLPYNLHIDS